MKWVFLILLSTLSTQLIGQLSDRTANYKMEVTLDVENKQLHGTTQLTWTNPSNDTITELRFHLYYNAFKNSQSTFMKERGGVSDFLKTEDAPCHWGWTEISQITDERGNNLTDNMKYIHPDDDNTADQSVLQVVLFEGIMPNETRAFDLTWNAQIPAIKPRTGYNKDFYFFAQWFPKVGVYEAQGVRGAEKGRWNCHQYHSIGEYYSDFGIYDVSLDVPAGYQVGSSGKLLSKIDEDNRSVYRYYVEGVIDFTWTCSPHFIVQKSKWKDVEISFLSYPGHEHWVDQYTEALVHALNYLDEYVGVYPYKTLTMVDPPIHGIFTGGMEYPTLITSLSFCFLPKGLKTTETLVVHEFVHQYFMQMVATHEVEDTWMDEGLTTYYENRILDHAYGEKTSLVDCYGITCGSGEYNRAEFFASANPKIAKAGQKSYEFKHGGYGAVAYNKTAIWLRSLEGLIGRACFDRAMKRYFKTWKFKHPGRMDFENAFNYEVSECHGDKFGENLDWFFQQVIDGTDICDYAVANIEYNESTPIEGYIENIDSCIVSDAGYKPSFVSKVILHRLGELTIPIELKVDFDDGTSTIEYWDGINRSTEFVFVGRKKIINAEIDPDRKNPLDINYLNNGLVSKPNPKGLKQIFYSTLSKVQHFFESVSIFI